MPPPPPKSTVGQRRDCSVESLCSKVFEFGMSDVPSPTVCGKRDTVGDTTLSVARNPLRREPSIRLKPPGNKRFGCSLHCFSWWIQSQWKTERERERGSKGSPLLRSGVHWPHPPSPFSRSSSSISFSFSLVVVAELRMDHYVISRQAFNCFRDERESERGWHSWHVRPRPPRPPHWL